MTGESLVALPNIYRNEHNHLVIRVTGRDLSGEDEIKRLATAGYDVTSHAHPHFIRPGHLGYDFKHRCEDEKLYDVALISTAGVQSVHDRTTEDLQRQMWRYGYHDLPAGVVPRLREAIPNTLFDELGTKYLVVFHEPIVCERGGSHFLGINKHNQVDAFWTYPRREWNQLGLFAALM